MIALILDFLGQITVAPVEGTCLGLAFTAIAYLYRAERKCLARNANLERRVSRLEQQHYRQG